MDCDNCELRKKTSFLSVGRNCNTTQFNSQEGRNCESCENYYTEDILLKNWSRLSGGHFVQRKRKIRNFRKKKNTNCYSQFLQFVKLWFSQFRK